MWHVSAPVLILLAQTSIVESLKLHFFQSGSCNYTDKFTTVENPFLGSVDITGLSGCHPVPFEYACAAQQVLDPGESSGDAEEDGQYTAGDYLLVKTYATIDCTGQWWTDTNSHSCVGSDHSTRPLVPGADVPMMQSFRLWTPRLTEDGRLVYPGLDEGKPLFDMDAFYAWLETAEKGDMYFGDDVAYYNALDESLDELLVPQSEPIEL